MQKEIEKLNKYLEIAENTREEDNKYIVKLKQELRENKNVNADELRGYKSAFKDIINILLDRMN